MSRGRPEKPLAQKVAEGSRIREDRINRDAPVPPGGRPEAPADLTAAELTVWNITLELAAPGQIRPLDGGLLRRYCWTVADLQRSIAGLEAWRQAPKQEGETDQLKKSRNGELGVHPLYGHIDRLHKTLDKQEAALGLNPVSREKIRASIQADLFSDPDISFDEFLPPTPGVQ